MEIEKKILELLDEKEEAIVDKATALVLGKPMHDITSSLTSMMDNSDVYSWGAKEYLDKKSFLSFLEIFELWNKEEKAIADKAKVSVLGKPMHDITSSLTSMVDNSDVYSCAVKEYFDTKPFLSFLKVDKSPLVPWNRGPTSATAKVNDDTTSTSSLSANLSSDDTTSTSSLIADLSSDDTTSTSSLIADLSSDDTTSTSSLIADLSSDDTTSTSSLIADLSSDDTTSTSSLIADLSSDDTTSTSSLIADLSSDDTTSTSSLIADLSSDDTTSTSSLSTDDDDDDSSSNEGQQFMQFQPGSFFSYDLFEIRVQMSRSNEAQVQIFDGPGVQHQPTSSFELQGPSLGEI
ncbi:hypothetical protein FCV25MIE_24029 [Fagus crenata]